MPESENCAVIGAGIIGICCGISLLERGHSVTLYDPAPPGSMTSKGNAGGFGFADVMPMASPGVWKRVPKWLMDPYGPLFIDPLYLPRLLPWLWRFYKMSAMEQVIDKASALSDLLAVSQNDSRELLKKTRSMNLFTESGAITVYKSGQAALKDKLEWDIKKQMGVVVEELRSAREINAMEPELINANFGYFTPRWGNTPDPYKLAGKLAAHFGSNGGEIQMTKITQMEKTENKVVSLVTENGSRVRVGQVVIAAGAWSKKFCKQLGDKVLMESERGYNTTLPEPGVSLKRQVIFAEEKFVITNIGNGLRIGGAAEFAGLRRSPDYRRSERLVEIARRYLPGLDDTNGKKWMGHRASTPDSIPVIGPSRGFKNVFHAFGHGHYGLTMAASTGSIVAQLVSNQPTSIDIKPFAIDRFN